jgi:hypothetical protein
MQLSPVNVTAGATSAIDAVLTDPFKLALTVAVPSVFTAPAVAPKLAAVDPPAAVINPGTVRLP